MKLIFTPNPKSIKQEMEEAGIQVNEAAQAGGLIFVDVKDTEKTKTEQFFAAKGMITAVSP
jgi:hypothetical protein